MKKFVLFLISALVISALILVSEEGVEDSEETMVMGIYEICSDLDDCDLEKGIKKIKEAGFKKIILTVIDENQKESLAYYPSQYLKEAEYIQEDYLKKVVNLAHSNDLEIVASINLPHNYWLKDHPDWITVWSDGKPGDFYEEDYFHRTVPPSRIVSEPECKELLTALIKEVESYGVDGIDINDNFQFSDQYVEERDETLFSSYDQFTLSRVEGDWFEWRAEQVTALVGFLNQATSLPFRVHLLAHEDPYKYYGLDFKEIEKEVNMMYFMIMPDQPKEKYDIVDGFNSVAVSTYLFEDWTKMQEVIELIRSKEVDEIYLYNFKLVEENNLWEKF